MSKYKYLIIGGGMAADAAVGGIREIDPDGAIGMIGSELHPPYDRPPLSKALWKGKPLEKIWRANAKEGAALHLGRTAVALDAGNKRVTDDQGHEYSFDKLLLATGGTPRRLSVVGDGIVYFRTLDDYQRLRRLTEAGQRFAVIGGGFIGSEIAAALCMIDKDVVMIFPEETIGARIFPPELGRFLNEFYREKGVQLMPGEAVVGMERCYDRSVLTTIGGRTIAVDGVVAGIGIQPNVELAQSAGLTVDNGVSVDISLCTSHPDIYAAGDVAEFFNPVLGMRMRVEHEDNANTMGRVAGLSMAGEHVVYDHLPSFYSDLFELGYEAVGMLDPSLEVVPDWKEPFHEGVIYYLEHGRVRGVLLWNVWEQVDTARRLIGEVGPFEPAGMHGQVPL